MLPLVVRHLRPCRSVRGRAPSALTKMDRVQRQENEAFVGLRISQNPALCYVFDGRGKAFMLPISPTAGTTLTDSVLRG
jgi:hypothetical protein